MYGQRVTARRYRPTVGLSIIDQGGKQLQAGKSGENGDPPTSTHLYSRMLPHRGTFAPATWK